MLAFATVTAVPSVWFVLLFSFLGKPAPNAATLELAFIGLVFHVGFSLFPGIWEYARGSSKQLIVRGAGRSKYYAVASAGALAAFVLYSLAGAQTLSLYSLSLAIVAALFAGITRTWNISSHVGSLSVGLTAVMFEFGRTSWWVLILLIPVALMRVERKAHGVAQVIAAAIVGIGVAWVVFSLLGARVV